MTARVDLPGIGEPHPDGAALFVLIDEERVASGDCRDPSTGKARAGARYQIAHVVSRWSRGEVRGYVVHDGVADVRSPAYPESWPEVDRAVAEALGVRVVGVAGGAPEGQLALFGGAS
jgi:hypothetical protein